MKKQKQSKKAPRQSIRPSEDVYSMAMVAQMGESGTLGAYDKKINPRPHHHHHHHHHHHTSYTWEGNG